jgi:DNA processing protein
MVQNSVNQIVSDAYLTLAHWCEPADPRIVAALERWEPPTVVERIKNGKIERNIRPETAKKIAQFSLQRERDYAHSIGASIVTRGESGWPTQLEDLKGQEPFALWSLGNADFRLMAARSIAIVGTRNCTPYGRQIARDWAAEFGQAGVTVVSGGALGIDVAAHQGALDVEAPTICVLAGGVESRYPKANESIFGQILDSGVLISESPPRESPRRQRFITRNRIIAALSKATVIVEAAERSGTESTANRAHEMNRLVFGVPGSVHSSASMGVHELIRQRTASIVQSPDDVLDLIDVRKRDDEQLAGKTKSTSVPESFDWRSLKQRELDVWESMPIRGALLVADLVDSSGRSMSAVLGALAELELMGLVARDGLFWKRL